MMIVPFLFLNLLFCIEYTTAGMGLKFTETLGLKPGWGFKGRYDVDENLVQLIPIIKATPIEGISKSMLICGFTVHHEKISFLPFSVILLDKRWGTADIKLKSNITKGSLKESYIFQIEAYDCDEIPHFSERKFVVIEFDTQRPMFSSSSYHFSVNSSAIAGTKIGTVTAFERPDIDLLQKWGQGICKYAIKSPSKVPFSINEYGVLSTKALVLREAKSMKYKFTVEATDCRKPLPKKNSVDVSVDVYNDCRPHWTGLSSYVNYNGEKGVMPIVLNKSVAPLLHMCSNDCGDMLAVINVKLLGQKLRPASSALCLHDEKSLKLQEKMCDISKNGIEMLALAHDSLKDKDNGGYYFPGDSVVNVDPKMRKFGHVLLRKFTIIFWMKHGDMGTKGFKEQILCNSDGQEHNRHHFSLFLHNCKLILLFRKEYGEAAQDQYEPSEWRYGPLKEVCDNKWHHYSVQFNDGLVFVQIDGEITKEQPQSLDDKPMKQFPNEKTDTKFTVAGCYHAKSNMFVQYFKGHLASMKVFEDELEAINNIRCIATCGEALLLPHIVDLVGLQSSVTLFSDTVIIRSHDIFNLLQMFSGLSYINTEISNEVRGDQMLNRTVTIDVDFSCDGKVAWKADQRTIVIHLSKDQSHLKVKSQTVSIRGATDIKGYINQKIPLFKKIKIFKNPIGSQSIKSCTIYPMGHQILQWESIEWPIESVIKLHLTGLNNSYGLVLEGQQIFEAYEIVLRDIYYVTRKYVADEDERKFTLICSCIDKTVTNKVVVTVKIRQRDTKTYYIVDDPNQNKEDSAAILHLKGRDSRVGFEERTDNSLKKKGKKSVTSPIMWVIVIPLFIVLIGLFVGFVVFYKRRFPSKKVFLNDNDERKQGRMMTLIHNASYSENGLHAADDIADDESLTNGLPDSEGDDDEDEDETEFVDDEKKERIVIPNYLGIPSGARIQPVDV